jgi:hypothetical protein
MENNRHGKALVLRKSMVSRALAVAFGSVALAGGVATTAYAQSNATGTAYGKVDAPAGSTVVLTSKDTGAKRVLPVDASGRFNGQSLTTGPYKAELVVGGKVTKSEDIEVRLGQGTEVFVGGTTLTTVQVVGTRAKIDVASVGSTTVFTASDLAKVPVASNVGAVIQLAPNTTRGDSRYGGGNAPSFGGSSASENAYYINGFPVTNMLQQVGFSQLPFNSIAQAQVLTGGYGAEFGRSTGGVVNIVTKSGGNSWVAGGAVSYEPAGLRSRERDINYEYVGTVLDGKLQFYNAMNTQSREQLNAYIGGPIIQDKLFIYASLENTRLNRDSVRTANTSAAGSITTAGFQEADTETPRGLLKLDWNLTDAHHLEYTHIYDDNKIHRRYYGFNYQTLTRDNVRNGGIDIDNWGSTNADAITQPKGAKVDIIKYTGYFTDDLTFTALAGRVRSDHLVTPNGYNPNLAQIAASSAVMPAGLAVPPNPQSLTGTLLVPGAYDENKGFRLDIEYKLGNHDIRAGLDRNTINSKAGSSTAGGVLWTYGKTDPTVPSQRGEVPSNTVTGNPYAQQGYIVQKSISATASTPTVDQSAWYIEDKYKVTDNVLLSLGLRNEGFNNKNGDGKSYIDLPTQLAPRLGVSWDLNGDASTKVYANLGRYHVPLPTNVAVRGAGSSLNTTQTFTYTGYDANGAPTGLVALGNPISANNEYGQAKDPRSVAAEGMDGNYQDEFAVGFEKSLTKEWNVGGKLTYRSLKSVIDDHCDDRPFIAWAARNHVDASNFGYNCALFNPGKGNTFNIDIDGDGKLEHIVLSAADLGMPMPDRKYVALDLFAEHPFDGKWWAKVTYTWSRNSGNTEGQLLSDIGQGDVATTQAWDFPEFSINANGLLPNNRTHQVKLFGYVQVTPEWGVGGNLLAATGRPKNCIGNAPSPVTGNQPFHPGDPVTNYAGYGSAYFFCDGLPSPRGSYGTLPPDVRVDLNFQFKPESFKGLGFKVDIFNVFNQQVAEAIEERKYNTNLSTVRTTYQVVQSYTAPRSVKFTASYDYKF